MLSPIPPPVNWAHLTFNNGLKWPSKSRGAQEYKLQQPITTANYPPWACSLWNLTVGHGSCSTHSLSSKLRTTSHAVGRSVEVNYPFISATLTVRHYIYIFLSTTMIWRQWDAAVLLQTWTVDIFVFYKSCLGFDLLWQANNLIISVQSFNDSCWGRV